jgi:ABC-2 type transport system permease protein
MNPRRLWTLVRREIQATFRDRFTVAILVAVPIFALAIFGFVLTTDVEHLSLGLFDAAHSAASRRIAAELAANGTFDVEEFRSTDAIGDALVRGRIQAGVVIPPDFDDDRRRPNHRPRVQVLYDAAETPLAGNVEASIQTLLRSTGMALVSAEPQRIEHPNGIAVVTRAVFNPKLDGKPFMVAGTFGFVLSFLTTLITAVSIVNEKLQGTFEQLQVTPATSLEIFLGKILPLGAIFAVDVVLMVLVAGFGLGVWPEGSAILFIAVSVVYLLVSLSLGLLFSATSSTAAEAVQKTVLFSVPLIQLSGFMFPIRNMPTAIQWFTAAMPATHYIAIGHAIYLRGEGFAGILPNLVYVIFCGVALVFYALRAIEARG